MYLRPVLSMAAGAALLLVSMPAQASALADVDQIAPCSVCIAQPSPEPVVAPPSDTWRVAALSKAPRRYTRTDIEGLRLLTRMR